MLCFLILSLGHFLSYSFPLVYVLKTLVSIHFEISICGPSQGDAERSGKGLEPQSLSLAGGHQSLSCHLYLYPWMAWVCLTGVIFLFVCLLNVLEAISCF